ncbi:hypothetical protein QAD02_000663 [Eretmocerus hayati]|uniref:Uncharacterized protein n=1 Tax=Eretmocerus hayati TaxID=131215 RepID=A0ACC2NEA9_9HYME|nr:hypothetical protein QAD02_000663 [Eretmocerus hayati]
MEMQNSNMDDTDKIDECSDFEFNNTLRDRYVTVQELEEQGDDRNILPALNNGTHSYPQVTILEDTPVNNENVQTRMSRSHSHTWRNNDNILSKRYHDTTDIDENGDLQKQRHIET